MRVLDAFTHTAPKDWQGKLERGAGAFPDGRAGATIRGQITSEVLERDWRGFGSLQFTLFNPWDRPVVGGIDLFDDAALKSPELDYGDYVGRSSAIMIPEGLTHVVIRIAPIQTTQGNRMLDLERVARVVLHAPEPLAGEAPLSIAALRLCKEHDGVDESAKARPGDSIMRLRHLDVSCFTHEPEGYRDPEDVLALRVGLDAEVERLRNTVTAAELNGKQTHYARAALVAADAARYSRPLLAWHFSPRAKRANFAGALDLVSAEREKLEGHLSSRLHEDDEDDSNLPLSLVKPTPDLKDLRIQGRRFVDAAGRPVLLCAMNYHNEGALLQFFTTARHREEIYAVGGGSRYDIESSPVYAAYHEHFPASQRVGWRGWCGHLIKDQWAMGGRKENVLLCLEHPRILEAIDAYNRLHADDWRHAGLAYVILAYELSYICYCDESLRRFRVWLAERHGSIENLNRKWGTAYRSLEEAAPPPAHLRAPALDANRAAWFDWAEWNARRFTDHLLWSRASVRKLDSRVPLCAGGTHSMFSPGNGTAGIDEELIINEVDDVILHEGSDILGIDLFHALAETPKPLVDPEQGGDCRRWFLNYFHGKSAIAKFWWPRQPSRQFPNSTLRAPLHGTMPIPRVFEHLRAALDVRRLNEEIVAFWDVPKEVAILYSRTNVLQVPPALMTARTTPYLAALRESYEAGRCLDTPVTFLSERQLLAGKAQGLKLLVLPAVKHLPEPVFAALDRYVRAGGTLLLLPESLTADEYNHPVDYLARWGLEVLATEAPAIEGLGAWEQGYDQNLDRPVRFGVGRQVEAARMTLKLDVASFRTAGLFQEVRSMTAEVAAAGPAGEPLLLKLALGKGRVWYLAGFPERASLAALLDFLYVEVGVARSLKVTDAEGHRVLGLEARLARRRDDDLLYLVNESGREVSFRIQTDRPFQKLRELRSLRYYPQPEGRIANGETLLFSLREDPVARARRTGKR